MSIGLFTCLLLCANKSSMVFTLRFVEKLFLSHYVGVQHKSADVYNVYLLARLLGETVVEATGNKELCDTLGKSNTVSFCGTRSHGIPILL